ncbi:DUF6193 family natural product biosynthesis protein [Microbispora bryophytorum]|uniref:DUF6193 family natural product biosynthesis protein n=1 Tax=Microbispora bryophytorum TaxID=1460882 RepID=UPI0033C3673A
MHDLIVNTSRSSTDIVEAAWQKVRADGRVRPELLNAAYAEPRLRQLFPWTGMGELHFSRCTSPRWTWDIPYIASIANGGYMVEGLAVTRRCGLPQRHPRPLRWWWNVFRTVVALLSSALSKSLLLKSESP